MQQPIVREFFFWLIFKYERMSILFCLDNQLMQLVNQSNRSVDTQTISVPLLQLGEQLTLALVCCSNRKEFDLSFLFV